MGRRKITSAQKELLLKILDKLDDFTSLVLKLEEKSKEILVEMGPFKNLPQKPSHLGDLGVSLDMVFEDLETGAKIKLEKNHVEHLTMLHNNITALHYYIGNNRFWLIDLLEKSELL
ncbi:MAG: hypothetical protein ACFFCS_09275 [Candidatus Hodarchaeota archaeon]